MASCAIKVCRNYRGRLKMTSEVTFHQIPSDPILKSKWVKVIQKSRGDDLWTPSKTTGICSDHFHEHDFLKTQKRRRLKKGAVPCKALYLTSVDSDSSTNSEETNTLQELNPVTTDCQNSDIPSGVQLLHSTDSCKNVVHTTCIASTTGELTENIEDFSDIDSVFDSPNEAKLRKDLRTKIRLQRKHALKIQSLRRKNLRLKKKVASFKTILEELRKYRYINNDTHDVLRSNVFAADLYASMIKRLQGKCKRPKSKYTPDFRKLKNMRWD